MYKIDSDIATEFIDHEEILESIDFAQKNKSNANLIKNVIEKAKNLKGLSHKEAILLLECDMPELNQKIFELADYIKKNFMAIEL